MKLVRKARLHFQKDKSDKVYEVDLCELSSREDERYLVNFRYGRRSSRLREGSKTEDPVSYEKAVQLFDSVVVSKTNKGYIDADTKAASTTSCTSSVPTITNKPSKRALSDALIQQLPLVSDSKERARMIWRLGEIGDIEDCAQICTKIRKGHWLEDYSIAWALGRLGDSRQLDILETLFRSPESPVRRMAYEAKLKLSEHFERKTLLEKVEEQISDPLVETIRRGDVQAVIVQLSTALNDTQQNDDKNELLISCYQLSLIYPALHQALLSLVERVDFKPGYFKGIRYLYKMAEFRLDAPMFGRLSEGLESKSAFFRNEYDWTWMPGVGSLTPSKELKKHNSRLAYSSRTRDYFRRRNWRSIKRLGECDDLRYIDMAYHILLAISDQHASEPKHTEIYHWDYDGNHYHRNLASSNDYGRFAGHLAFNHILYQHSAVYSLSKSGRAWCKNSEGEDQGRTDCYPHLWDQKPDLVLSLLKLSRCEHVHRFAKKVLEVNEAYCQAMSEVDLISLLASPYQSTCEFALAIVKQRIEQAPDNHELLLALLESLLADARAFGVERLTHLSLDDLEISNLSKLLLIEHTDVSCVVVQKMGSLRLFGSQQDHLLLDFIQQVFANEIPISETHATLIAPLLLKKMPSAVEQLALTIIGRLLASEEIGKQVLGAQLLAANKVAFKDIPDSMIHQIQGSTSPIVRGLGTALLGKQPDEELIENVSVLIELFEQGEPAERAAVLTILARLARKRRVWAETVLDALLQLAFKAENKTGQTAELISFTQAHLTELMSQVDNGIVWRLLTAKSKAAQLFGGLILGSISILEFSVKQWALLGHHVDHNVREIIHAAYNKYPLRIKENSRDGLRILDGVWEDSRAFAFAFFNEQFKDDDWSPALVISLCDSVKDDVQNYGREILQRHFKAENGVEYLIKLSQHPSINVQLFVSGFLAEYAGGNGQRVIELRDYFCTVLSQVYKGRLCKNRIYKFLLKEALASQEVAAMVAELFTRLSVTVVQADRSLLVKAMMELEEAHPNLALPITHVPLPMKEFA